MKLLQMMYMSIPVCICIALYLFYVWGSVPLGHSGGHQHLPSSSSPSNMVLKTRRTDPVKTLDDITISDIFNRSLPCRSGGQCRPSSGTKVILLTYMRSGSSFTGDILSANPEVFYVFEPVHFVAQANNTIFDYLRQRKVRYGSRKTYLMRKTMSGFLNCNFEEVDIGTLTQYHMNSSKKTRPYFTCLHDNHGIFGLIHCLPWLYRKCYQAEVVLTKTIALPMHVAATLSLHDPQVKIIHLVRDPRATIWSEGRYGLYSENSFSSFVHKFCNSLLHDLIYLQKIKNMYPNRARLLLYENLADNPVDETTSLYHFMNLPMIPEVTAHVRNLTMNGHEETCPMCISKADSAKSSQEWRTHLNFHKAQYIDKVCSRAYTFLGYKNIYNEDDYFNLSFPLHSWPNI